MVKRKLNIAIPGEKDDPSKFQVSQRSYEEKKVTNEDEGNEIEITPEKDPTSRRKMFKRRKDEEAEYSDDSGEPQDYFKEAGKEEDQENSEEIEYLDGSKKTTQTVLVILAVLLGLLGGIFSGLAFFFFREENQALAASFLILAGILWTGMVSVVIKAVLDCWNNEEAIEKADSEDGDADEEEDED